MSTINGNVCVANGTPVDKVFSNGKQVYGRNLLTGTSNQVVQATDWNMQAAKLNYGKSLGSDLCASVMINNADGDSSFLSHGSANIYINTYDKSGNDLTSAAGNNIGYNTNGLSQCHVSIDDNTASVQVHIYTNWMNANAYYSCLKLEKGTTPTPWTPAPEDVLK